MDENGLPGTGLITSNNFNSRKYRSRIKAGLPCEITSVWRLFRDVKRGSFSNVQIYKMFVLAQIFTLV